MRSPLSTLAIVASIVACLIAGPAHAACDVVANATDLALARDAIDAACPCAAATKPGDHGQCARPVLAARIAGGMLDKACKSEALKHATKSICGRPGAAVCCRVKSNGKTAHKIVKESGKCVSTSKLTSCVSELPSVPTGCDANGCVTPVCGNYVVEGNETCDPPQTGVCDANCRLVTCDPPVTSCGNGVIDPDEACEPPGAGACGWDCAVASCAAPDTGELAIACSASPTATMGAGARSGEYLVAWNDLVYRTGTDIVARRLDADGGPADTAATIVSSGVQCSADEAHPAVGSDAAGWVVGWAAVGPAPGAPFQLTTYARPMAGSGALGHLDELASVIPFGMCQGTVGDPLSLAPAPVASSTTFAVAWRAGGACFSGPVFVDPDAFLLDYATAVPSRTTVTIGYFPAGSFPAPLSDTAASLATAGTTTFAVWHAHLQSTTPPYASNFRVVGTTVAANGTTSPVSVSTRQPGIGSELRPSIAAATDRFLVAWADGPVDVATDIRAMRVGAPGGPLDPDGGIVLASTVGGAPVVGGPVVAFDGTQWLVVWTEAAVGGNDLRAVAVATDGTVLDAVPRLVVSGVGASAPAIASAGDGRSLVVYAKPDGGKSAIRARLVPGT